MSHGDIREKFLKFFEKRGHKIVPSSSLLPTDPSVLFTTAGMQQFKPYYTGQSDPMKDFGSLNTASIQKSMRTSDIDKVGDESHLTFFEMLGNFSFGGYFKKEAIEYAYDFVTKELGLTIDYVSVFGGEEDIPADKESEKIWKSLDRNIDIREMGRSDNFWGPTGKEGPCGPTTEIYVNGVEIWNIVFNEYYCNEDKSLSKLDKPGIDTGMGLERLAMVAQKKGNIFETDLFEPLIQLLPGEMNGHDRIQRIIVDHSRAAAFLISDGVVPSNKEQGYVLRRLLRRVIVHSHNFGLELDAVREIFGTIAGNYGRVYPELDKEKIISEFDKENEKFQKTLKGGLKELGKLNTVDSASAFKLYESFGLPYEVIKEVGGNKAETLTRSGFEQEMKRHREISRAGADKKFGGHGLLMDTGELKAGDEEELKKVTRLHTATHLLHASLRKILDNDVQQQGSDITPERLRFDFTFSRKLTPEELQQVEDMVNDAIKKELPVIKTEMSYKDAIRSGALAFFKQKYPNRVTVYTIGPELVEGQNSSTRTSSEPQPNSSEPPFSRELCGGPHVSNTREIGKFKIIKEEAVSADVRRIRAMVEGI
ncbi:MAG: alanine--tRNA ligase [Candidatus Yanofskybacteria bacterium]|nr:alanine--tRNA ligase [Candidatus Yanofskybacteria bacterium]